jgi:hypothetical protein
VERARGRWGGGVEGRGDARRRVWGGGGGKGWCAAFEGGGAGGEEGRHAGGGGVFAPAEIVFWTTPEAPTEHPSCGAAELGPQQKMFEAPR